MYRLIYKSRSHGPITWDLVNAILDESQESNAEHGISGVLLATNTHFLQAVEGPYDAVNHVFMNIVRDQRHRDVQLVGFSCVESRLFGDWAMHGVGVFDFNLQLARELKKKYGEEDGEVRFPTEEWQALAMIHDIRMVHD